MNRENLLNFKKSEIIMVGLISLFLTFGLIMFSDMRITSVGSYAFLQGHFLDFYDYNTSNSITSTWVYFPTMYWIFAIWNIPAYFILGKNPLVYGTRRMSVLLYWDKVLVLIACVITLIFFNKICMICFHEKTKSLFTTLLLAFSPYLFIGEMAFGAYDYLYMMFAIMGIYYYLQDDKNWWWKFSLLFGFSFTIKQLTLFIWLPLLLYREKNIVRLMKNVLVAFSFYLFEIILYHSSPYFMEHVLNSPFMLYMTKMSVNNGMCNIAIWGIIFGLFACFCYWINFNEDNKLLTIWIAMIGPIILLITSHWTVNWILLYVPMLIILLVSNAKRERLYLFDLAFGVLYVLMLFYQQVNYWGYVFYGEGMLDYSIFAFLRNDNNRLITSHIVPVDLYPIIMGAMYSILIFFVIILAPIGKRNNNSDVEAINDKDRKWLVWKFVFGTMIYIVPIFIGVLPK